MSTAVAEPNKLAVDAPNSTFHFNYRKTVKPSFVTLLPVHDLFVMFVLLKPFRESSVEIGEHQPLFLRANPVGCMRLQKYVDETLNKTEQ